MLRRKYLAKSFCCIGFLLSWWWEGSPLSPSPSPARGEGGKSELRCVSRHLLRPLPYGIKGARADCDVRRGTSSSPLPLRERGWGRGGSITTPILRHRLRLQKILREALQY